MSDAFDPYYIWLGIPPEDQPPHHYRLLGVTLFESNREVIEAAANRQMAYMQEVSGGEENIDEAQEILGELSKARVCLLNQEKKKAYDDTLRASFDALAPAPKTTAEQTPAASATPTADDSLIPPQFGLPDDEAGTVTEAPTIGQAKHRPHATGKSKKKQGLGPIIGLAVVLLILLIGGIAFLLSSRAENLERKRTAEILKKENAAKWERQVKAEAEAREKAGAAEQKIKKQQRLNAAAKAKRKTNEEAERKNKLLASIKKDFNLKLIPDDDQKMGPDIFLQYLGKLQPTEKNAATARELKDFRQKIDKQIIELNKNDRLDKKLKEYSDLASQPLSVIQASDIPKLPPWAEKAIKDADTKKAKENLAAEGLFAWSDGEWTDSKANKHYKDLVDSLFNDDRAKTKLNKGFAWKNGGDVYKIVDAYEALREKNLQHKNNSAIIDYLSILRTKISTPPIDRRIEENARTFLTDEHQLTENKDGIWQLSNVDTEQEITVPEKKQPTSYSSKQKDKLNSLILTTIANAPKEMQQLLAYIKANGKVPGNRDPHNKSWNRFIFLFENAKPTDRAQYGDFQHQIPSNPNQNLVFQVTKQWAQKTLRNDENFIKLGKNNKPLQSKNNRDYDKIKKNPRVETALRVVGGTLPPVETDK